VIRYHSRSAIDPLCFTGFKGRALIGRAFVQRDWSTGLHTLGRSWSWNTQLSVGSRVWPWQAWAVSRINVTQWRRVFVARGATAFAPASHRRKTWLVWYLFNEVMKRFIRELP